MCYKCGQKTQFVEKMTKFILKYFKQYKIHSCDKLCTAWFMYTGIATKLGDINSFQIKATCTAVSASIGKVKKKNVLMEISKKKIYHTLFTL